MRLADIKLNENNPRTISEVKFERLKASIKEFEKMMELRPIVIDEDGVVLGGNMRTRALQALGYDEIPDNWVKRAEGLSEEEKRRFVIEDNVPFGEWDWDALFNEWDTEQLQAWGLDLPVWDIEPEDKKQATDDEFDETKEKIEERCCSGDIWLMGEHRLMCGDSTDIEQVNELMGG